MCDHFKALHRWIIELHSKPRSREELESVYTKVWDEQQLLQDFDVLGFTADVVDVRRKADGVRGSLSYQDNPRFYFSFIADL